MKLSRILFSLILVLTLTAQAQAVDLTIKLPEAKALVTVSKSGTKTIDWRPAISAAADELKILNPDIPINKKSAQVESMIGDVMTPPNEFGYSTIRISDLKRVIVTEEFIRGLPSAQIIIGDTSEEKVIATKEIIGAKGAVIGTEDIIEVIRGGKIQ